MEPKKDDRIAPGGIVHTQYELDAHSNQMGPLAEELYESELPLERVAWDGANKHGEKDVRDVDSDTKD